MEVVSELLKMCVWRFRVENASSNVLASFYILYRCIYIETRYYSTSIYNMTSAILSSKIIQSLHVAHLPQYHYV